MQPPWEPLVIFPFQGSGASTERAPASFRVQSSLLQLLPDKSGRRSKERCPEHSLFSTGQGGQGPWGGPSTLRTAQALPCQAGQSWALEDSDSCSAGSQGRPGARVSKHLPLLTGTPASQRTRPGRQCDNASGAVLPQPGQWGAGERMNHWLPGGWCLGRERRAASEARLVLSVHHVICAIRDQVSPSGGQTPSQLRGPRSFLISRWMNE